MTRRDGMIRVKPWEDFRAEVPTTSEMIATKR